MPDATMQAANLASGTPTTPGSGTVLSDGAIGLSKPQRFP